MAQLAAGALTLALMAWAAACLGGSSRRRPAAPNLASRGGRTAAWLSVLGLVAGLAAFAASCGGGGPEGSLTPTAAGGTPTATAGGTGTPLGGTGTPAPTGTAIVEPGGPVTISGVDVNPEANTATSLGPIERCVSVAVGDTFDVDIFLDDVPARPDPETGEQCDNLLDDDGDGVPNDGCGFGGFGGLLDYDASKLRATDASWDWLMGIDPDSVVTPLAITLSPPPVNMTVTDLSSILAAEPPGTRGVLGRITFSAVGGSDTTTSLTLTPEYWTLVDAPGNQLNDIPGDAEDNDNDGQTDEDPIWDGNFSPLYGVIAIDRPCPD